MTSGRPPFQGTTSALPPAPRIRSATQSAARTTSLRVLGVGADGRDRDQLGELVAKLVVEGGTARV